MEVDWVEGETAKRIFVLKEDGAPFNGTGFTPTLVLVDRTGAAVDTTGDVAWEDAATGKVSYTPDAGDLVASNGQLRARFKVTDGGGGVGYFPRGEMDVWNVRKP
jgi:hypothetical protein